MDCSRPGSSVHGISLARLKDPASPALAGSFFTTEPPGDPREPQFPLLRDETIITLAFQNAEGTVELRWDSGGEEEGELSSAVRVFIVSIELGPRPAFPGLMSSALLLFYSSALFLFSESNLIMKSEFVTWLLFIYTPPPSPSGPDPVAC